MIVSRLTVTVKPGRMQELIDLIEDADGANRIGAVRIYTPVFATMDTVVIETEATNLEEFQRATAENFPILEQQGFFQRWAELVEPGASREIWTVAADF